MTETVALVTRNLVARDDNRGSQLAVFGKGSKTRPVLVPRSLFEELWALAFPVPTPRFFAARRRVWMGRLSRPPRAKPRGS